MSQSDFEDRLNRIKAGAGQKPASAQSGGGKPRFRSGRFVVACVTVAIGGQMIKVATTNYDAVRDQYGVGAALGLGLGSIAIMILGVVLMVRAIRSARGISTTVPSAAYAAREASPRIQTSAGARLFFSLFGLALGGLAAFFMYIGNAGRQLGVTGQVDIATANAMATGSAVAAILLVGLGLFIGFIGLFVRGFPMRRVPVFLVLGAMLLYTSFQTLRIHPSDWPVFMAEFTRSFQNKTSP